MKISDWMYSMLLTWSKQMWQMCHGAKQSLMCMFCYCGAQQVKWPNCCTGEGEEKHLFNRRTHLHSSLKMEPKVYAFMREFVNVVGPVSQTDPSRNMNVCVCVGVM